MNKPRWQILLDFVVKLCSLIVTAPVSWIIAGQLFSDVNILGLRYIMQAAAVLLVDTILVVHWSLLDYHKSAEIEQRVRYAVVSWTLYIGLFVLAIVHGEGLAGIVFRSAMGLAILSSTVDSFSEHWRELVDKAQNGVRQDWRVQHHRRKLARTEEIEARTLEHRKRLLEQADELYRFTEQMKAGQAVFNRELVHDTQSKLNTIDYIEGKAVPIEDVQLLLQETVQQFTPSVAQTVQDNIQQSLQVFVQELVQEATDESLQSMNRTVQSLVSEQIRTVHPVVNKNVKASRTVNTSTDETVLFNLRKLVQGNPGMTKTELAEQLNISRTTLYKYMPNALGGIIVLLVLPSCMCSQSILSRL